MTIQIKKRTAQELYEIFKIDYKKFSYIFKNYTIEGLNDDEDEDEDEDEDCCKDKTCCNKYEDEFEDESESKDSKLKNMSAKENDLDDEDEEDDYDPSEYALQFLALRMSTCSYTIFMYIAHDGNLEKTMEDTEISKKLKEKKIFANDQELEIIFALNLLYFEFIGLSNMENPESGIYSNDFNMTLKLPIEFLHESIETLNTVMQRIKL